MSHNAGGPSGPNVPPPPGQGPGGSYGGPQGPGGPGGPGQPYGAPQGGAPQKKSKTGLIAGIAGGIALILVLCCVGGFFLSRGDDDESSSTSTSAASTSESTSETSSESPSESETSSEMPSESETSSDTPSESSSDSGSGGDISLPSEFDGWKKVDTSVSAPAGGQVGAYTKGSEALSIVTMGESPGVMDSFEGLWSNEEKVGDTSCGKYSNQTQCAKVQDGNIILITHSGDAKTTAGYLDDFIAAL